MRRRKVILILLVPALLLLVALGGWVWLWHSHAGAVWAWQQAQSRLAQGSLGAKLEGRLEGTLGAGLHFTDLAYKDKYVTVTAEEAWLAGSLDLSPVHLSLSTLRVRGLEVQVAERQASGSPTVSGSTNDYAAPFPITAVRLEVQSASFAWAEQSLTIDRIQARVSWFKNLSVDVSAVEAPVASGAATAYLTLRPPYKVDSTLRVERFAVPEAMASRFTWLPDSPRSTLKVSGNLDKLGVEGEIFWPEWMPEAELAGQLETPLDGLSWSVDLTVPTATLPDRWLDSALDSKQALLEGRIDIQQFRVQARGGLEHYEFSGTTAAAAANFHSDEIAFEGAGDMSQFKKWSATSDAGIRVEGWPQGEVSITAGGTPDEFTGTVNAPSIFGGSLSATAQASLQEGTPWEAKLQARSLSTGPLIEAIIPHLDAETASGLASITEALQAESLDADIGASGRGDPMSVQVVIESLNGRVRGRNLTASGRLEYGEEVLKATGLRVRSGESSLVLDGSLYGREGLDIEVNIVALDDIVPRTAGSVTGQVHYRHSREQGLTGSTISADLQARNVQAFDWFVEDLRISSLNAPGESDRFPTFAAVPANPPIAVSLEAQNVNGPAGAFPFLSARLAGDFKNQALSVTTEWQEIGIAAGLSASRTGASSAVWNGTLQQLEIAPPNRPNWSLREPVPLRLSRGFGLQSACLTTEEGATACLDFEQSPGGDQRGRLGLTSFSANVLGFVTDKQLSFSQRLNGEMSWSRPAGEKLSALADFELTPGVVIDEAEDLELLHTQDGVFRFQVENGRLNAGQLDIPLDLGAIDVDFTIPDVLEGSASELDGRIRIELRQLVPVAGFFPQLSRTGGALSLDVAASGTVAFPQFEGSVKLNQGMLQLASTGLSLNDIELDGQLSSGGRVRLDGTFRAGEGKGEFRATVDLDDPTHPTFEADLSGTALTLIDAPDLSLRADTDIEADWDGEVLQLAGHIHVPWARFAPKYLPSDTATESADVIIVSGGEEVEQPKVEETDWKIMGELEVSMGDDVVIDLELARASMTGKVQFTWQGDAIPIAQGEYGVKGEIQAYGQRLDITRASIRFPDVPANNPTLDIFAERTIYGNPLITRAGVFVHGTLKRPITEPYTVPPTNADRARALLITGSDFNYETGVGAVSVGAYIAPKLYLSYGVGLFEQGNVITARYDLKSNFGVKATSGQDDTGIDFSYTIEK